MWPLRRRLPSTFPGYQLAREQEGHGPVGPGPPAVYLPYLRTKLRSRSSGQVMVRFSLKRHILVNIHAGDRMTSRTKGTQPYFLQGGPSIHHVGSSSSPSISLRAHLSEHRQAWKGPTNLPTATLVPSPSSPAGDDASNGSNIHSDTDYLCGTFHLGAVHRVTTSPSLPSKKQDLASSRLPHAPATSPAKNSSAHARRPAGLPAGMCRDCFPIVVWRMASSG